MQKYRPDLIVLDKNENVLFAIEIIHSHEDEDEKTEYYTSNNIKVWKIYVKNYHMYDEFIKKESFVANPFNEMYSTFTWNCSCKDMCNVPPVITTKKMLVSNLTLRKDRHLWKAIDQDYNKLKDLIQNRTIEKLLQDSISLKEESEYLLDEIKSIIVKEEEEIKIPATNDKYNHKFMHISNVHCNIEDFTNTFSDFEMIFNDLYDEVRQLVKNNGLFIVNKDAATIIYNEQFYDIPKKAFERVIIAGNWYSWPLSFATIVRRYRQYYEMFNSHNDETGFLKHVL